MMAEKPNKTREILICSFAAFATYFCMYAFRKPFSAGLYEDQSFLGLQLKTALILSQLLGYTASKFVGVKVVSEIGPGRRAFAIVGMILFAQLALVLFAVGPVGLKVVAMFLNGFPLGMVFGLVLSYLEGRRQTEAMTAILCASFIVSSGVVKSVGRWLVEVMGISEFAMPMTVGLIFALPTLLSVYLLSRTPPPDASDLAQRSERTPMTRAERRQFFQSFRFGICLLIFVYVCLTIVRTIRDDFAVEIWKDLGVTKTPSVFAQSEFFVGLIATAFAAIPVLIRSHLAAIQTMSVAICVSFGVGIAMAAGQAAGSLSPLAFMIGSGVALYVPYVAFHTTMFERLVAASKMPSNLGFLMYLADSIGYLGYGAIIVWKTSWTASGADVPEMLPVLNGALVIAGVASILAMLVSVWYFRVRFAGARPSSSPEYETEVTELETN